MLDGDWSAIQGRFKTRTAATGTELRGVLSDMIRNWLKKSRRQNCEDHCGSLAGNCAATVTSSRQLWLNGCSVLLPLGRYLLSIFETKPIADH